jgi:hypothetical protein
VRKFNPSVYAKHLWLSGCTGRIAVLSRPD